MNAGVYIYYSIDPAKMDAARLAVRQVFDRVAEKTGLHGKLLCRAADCSTWMEVYEPVAEVNVLLDVLDEAVAASGLTDHLQTGTRRHIEHFLPMDGSDH